MAINLDTAQLQAALEKLATGGAQPEQTPAELANRFQTLMQSAKLEPPAQPAGENGVQTASQMLKEQDAQLDHVSTDMDAFDKALPDMSLQQEQAEGMRLIMEMSTAQINLQAKMGVVESSKTSIETLMRNQ